MNGNETGIEQRGVRLTFANKVIATNNSIVGSDSTTKLYTGLVLSANWFTLYFIIHRVILLQGECTGYHCQQLQP